MKTDRLLKIILMLMIPFGFVIAQEAEVEELLESQEDYSDNSELMEILSELEQKPIDINSATLDQIAILPWISEVQAAAIIRFRQKNGKFNSIDELTRVKTISPATVKAIQRYVMFKERLSVTDFGISMKSRTYRKLQESVGLEDGRYYPSPFKYYNRLIVDFRSEIIAGGLLERDVGEKHFDDFTSFFLKYQPRNSGDMFILGNFRLEFANGLLFWNPYGQRQTNSPYFSTKKKGQELKEYTLVDENASLRGIAGKKCFEIYQFFIFYSDQQLDATLNPGGTVKNFYESGYHRTDTEVARQDKVSERLAGGRIKISPSPTFNLGLTGYISRFDRAIASGDVYRSRFAFSGQENFVAGSDFNLTFGSMNLFGESGFSRNRGYGALAGMVLHTSAMNFVTVVRHYSRDFNSLHGHSFSVQSDHPQNECGVFFGVSNDASSLFKFSFSYDQYKMPWRTYYTPMPASGNGLFLNIGYKPLKGLWLFFQTRAKQGAEVVDSFGSSGPKSEVVLPRNQLNLRFQIDYSPWSSLKLRHRIEHVRVNYRSYNRTVLTIRPDSEGLLLYQEFSYTHKQRLTASMRLTYFDTDNYDSRLYQFERDVPGMLTNFMLYGRGSRWYGIVQYQVGSHLKLGFKYSSTDYLHTESVGTGLDEIMANTVNTLTFQLESNW
ncbi:MAG: ComEA family DNA-binding protein [Candidatus Zhuqueibacterota bacterium]